MVPVTIESDNFMSALLEDLGKKYAHQPTYMQAVHECAESLAELMAQACPEHNRNRRAFKAMVEPERTISFRVSWRNRKGEMEQNRGWRVQYSSALGPYKGGLRLHPSVDEGILKFLGFEQIFKNALTGLPMGGGKGGSDFNPKGRTDAEVHAFCTAFMTELSRHIGADTDVPAGDIGVGGREIGYLFGAYKKLKNVDHGVLTGKGLLWGGSKIRPEATGYGCVYIADLAVPKGGLRGSRCIVSGSGNVAQYAAEKLLELGATVMTFSDSTGLLFKDEGFTTKDLAEIMDAKNVRRVSLKDVRIDGATWHTGSVWCPTLIKDVLKKVAVAFPCATQNEVSEASAEALVAAGTTGVFEGANMPCTRDAVKVLKAHKVCYIPGKAANAGGVAVSGLEMAQNSQRLRWSREKVDEELKGIMSNIYETLKTTCEDDFEKGANIAGFCKIAQAMDELGWI